MGICRLVERHFRHAPSPLACLDASLNTGAAVSGSQAAAQASTGSRQSTAAFPAAWVLAGAALRLVQLMPLQRRLHDQGTLLRLLQHKEADVRWLAARSLALLYNLVRSWRCGVACKTLVGCKSLVLASGITQSSALCAQHICATRNLGCVSAAYTLAPG